MSVNSPLLFLFTRPATIPITLDALRLKRYGLSSSGG